MDETKDRRREARGRRLKLLGTYLDDLLAVSGCICLTVSAALLAGAAAAFASGGVCLIACAVSVARSGRGR